MQEKTTIINQNVPTDFTYQNGRYADFELPIQIDLSELFEQHVSIKTKTKLKVGQLIGVDIQGKEEICSVVGKVERIKASDKCWEAYIELEYVPMELAIEFENYSSLMM